MNETQRSMRSGAFHLAIRTAHPEHITDHPNGWSWVQVRRGFAQLRLAQRGAGVCLSMRELVSNLVRTECAFHLAHGSMFASSAHMVRTHSFATGLPVIVAPRLASRA